MKLLLDENLSPRLVKHLDDLFRAPCMYGISACNPLMMTLSGVTVGNMASASHQKTRIFISLASCLGLRPKSSGFSEEIARRPRSNSCCAQGSRPSPISAMIHRRHFSPCGDIEKGEKLAQGIVLRAGDVVVVP